jgi:hypothetical protein
MELCACLFGGLPMFVYHSFDRLVIQGQVNEIRI